MRKIKAAAIQPDYIQLSTDSILSTKAIDNYVQRQLQVTTDLLEKCGAHGCDIVTTSEDIIGLSKYCTDISDESVFFKLLEYAQPIVESKLSELSKKYSMYIVGCYIKKAEGKYYNTAVIYDRQGSVMGEYKKTHLPADEKWICTEGDSIEVFDLDFGRIGICICYDMMFPEVVEVQALMGAEVIFHPTLGYGWYDEIGEATLRTRANDHSVYIVTSKNYIYNGAGKSSIIDHWGQVLEDAGFYKNAVVIREIDLDEPKHQPEWHYAVQTSGERDVRRRKRLERRPELYNKVCENLREKLIIPGQVQKMEIIKNIRNGECHW